MPGQETSHRFQKAVLWPLLRYDKHSNPIRGDGVELDVRWIFSRREVADQSGNRIAIDATVVVDRVIKVGSTMWLGELANWLGTGSDGHDDEVMEVKIFKQTADLKARDIYREVGLAYFKEDNADPAI